MCNFSCVHGLKPLAVIVRDGNVADQLHFGN